MVFCFRPAMSRISVYRIPCSTTWVRGYARWSSPLSPFCKPRYSEARRLTEYLTKEVWQRQAKDWFREQVSRQPAFQSRRHRLECRTQQRIKVHTAGDRRQWQVAVTSGQVVAGGGYLKHAQDLPKLSDPSNIILGENNARRQSKGGV